MGGLQLLAKKPMASGSSLERGGRPGTDSGSEPLDGAWPCRLWTSSPQPVRA